MNERSLTCPNHLEKYATGTCPRCGDLLCATCLPENYPGLCVTCRISWNLPTEDIYLTCQSCRNPLEPGFARQVSLLKFTRFENYEKYFHRPIKLRTHQLTWGQRIKQILEDLTTWGNSWLRADRCDYCQHILVGTRNYCFTREIRKRRAKNHAAHETPWGSTGQCLRCERKVIEGYSVRYDPSEFKSYEDFDRFFFLGYKNVRPAGVSWGDTFNHPGKLSKYLLPVFHCEPCAYAIIRYRKPWTSAEVRGQAKQVKEFRIRMSD